MRHPVDMCFRIVLENARETIHIDPSIQPLFRSFTTARRLLSRTVGRARRSLVPIAVICFLLVVAYSPAQGQSPVVLQGMVSDRSTGSPIAGVKVLPDGFGTPAIATTDANGNYSVTAQQLNNNASGTLYFQGSGYYGKAVITPST